MTGCFGFGGSGEVAASFVRVKGRCVCLSVFHTAADDDGDQSL